MIAPAMFALSLAFLAGVAVLVVLLVDVPSLGERVRERSLGAAEEGLERMAGVTYDSPVVVYIEWLLIAIWPLFWIELLAVWISRSGNPDSRRPGWACLLCAVCPPLRIGARNPDIGDAIWLPYWGWKVPDAKLRKSLVHVFGVPMLGIAILILPVLGVELLLQDQVARHPWLRTGLHVSTGLIWFAFALEFIVMISVAERKFAYCKQHWIDLAIILLPLISFLRSLQVLRATRVAKFAKVPQMAKLARAYRMRGVTTKAMRAFVILDLADRVMGRSPEKRIAHLRNEQARLSMELEEIQQRIEALQALHSGSPLPQTCLGRGAGGEGPVSHES